MSKKKQSDKRRKQQRWCKRAIIAVWDAFVRFVAWAERNGIVQFLLKVVFWRITGQGET